MRTFRILLVVNTNMSIKKNWSLQKNEVKNDTEDEIKQKKMDDNHTDHYAFISQRRYSNQGN